jgi:hypothetical protein
MPEIFVCMQTVICWSSLQFYVKRATCWNTWQRYSKLNLHGKNLQQKHYMESFGVKIYPYNSTVIFKVFKVWRETWPLREKFKSKIKMTEFHCFHVTSKNIMRNETLWKEMDVISVVIRDPVSHECGGWVHLCMPLFGKHRGFLLSEWFQMLPKTKVGWEPMKDF